VINDLKSKEQGHKLGWDRFNAAFLSKRTESSVSQLQRQCQTLDKLIFIDIATLVANSHKATRHLREEFKEGKKADENIAILRWLSPLSFEEKHLDTLSKLHPGTGEWLVELDQFKFWRDGDPDAPSTLWTPGIRKFGDPAQPF
jgi:hypothetical protein